MLLALLLQGANAQESPGPSVAESAPPEPATAMQTATVRVEHDAGGSRLLVNGEPFFVRGMNWDHSPIGTNYRHSLWVQSDAFIEATLEREMPLLQAMGVNAIRQYDDIPARWVQHIYERYGIYTMVNPLFGRYGLNVDGRWVPTVDYSDPKHRASIRASSLASVERLRNTPGVLLWLLGNENNYGLSWSSFEIEQLPQGERDTARARHLYSLVGEVVDAIHATDTRHPVALANGDAQYIDLIASEAPNLDIFGTNVYRGETARDLYTVVKAKLGIPVLYTEFGADAFNARTYQEDSLSQARYLLAQWKDLYSHAHGLREGNAIGGFVFQWADGWWKYRQDENLSVHDPNASWPNGGYTDDFVPGQNNMNEEWFGICAKGPTQADGSYDVYPRPAYYALKEAWKLDPYANALTDEQIHATFAPIQPGAFLPIYQTTRDAGEIAELRRVYVRDLRFDLSTFASMDSRTESQARFDHQQAMVLDVGTRPVAGLEAHAAVSVLGHVAANQLDDISYETRGRGLTDQGADSLDLSALERVRIYQLGATWDQPSFRLTAFHRTGHFHWGYKGDFFGLYREANYGESIDIYNADAPSGMEFEGKAALEGLAFAFGPQVYWGANPTAIGRYSFGPAKARFTVMHQEDLAPQDPETAARAIPQPVGRKSTLSVETAAGPVKISAGGVVAGTEQLGKEFFAVRSASGTSYGDSGYHVLSDEIQWFDTLGGKLKLTYEAGPAHLYALGTYRGLVANTGGDATTTFTGWTLRDHGVGNVVEGLVGAAFDVGRFQIAPNFLIQRPLEGPLPAVEATFDTATGWYTPDLTPRNVVDDAFAVGENRETVAGELLVVYDPTPGTWYWAWDAATSEDAPFAASLDLVYRHQPTSRDATIGFSAEGLPFVFSAAPEAADVWDATFRFISNPGRDMRLLGTAYVGQTQSTGFDSRLVTRYGLESSVWWKNTAVKLAARVNDYGPYDYYRTFNLTFPFQGLVDLSTGVAGLRLPASGTRLGIRGKVRTFDEYSPPAETSTATEGTAYEVATYLNVRL